MLHRRHLGRALLALAAVLSTGCVRTFVVVTATPPSRVEGAPAEVLQTDAYPAQRPALKSVAIRLPNECWKFEKRTADGAAQVSATLTAACAPWGEALPRALAAAGFKVTGLEEFLMLEAKQRMTPPAAAQWLGVNALLVVDKLDASSVPLEAARRAKLVVTQSDAAGSPGEPAALDELAQKGIDELVSDRVRPWGDQAVEAVAELRVTAVLPGSGTPLWRYARRVAAPEPSPAGFQMLLRGRARTWVPVFPDLGQPPPQPLMDPRLAEMAAARGSNPFTMKENVKPPDARPAVNLPALARELSTELATRFASGT